MTRVLSTAEHANVVAERSRMAWNLPRQPARATSRSIDARRPGRARGRSSRGHRLPRSRCDRPACPRLARLSCPLLPGTATTRSRGIDCVWRLQSSGGADVRSSWGRAARRVGAGLAGICGNRFLGRRGRGGSVGLPRRLSPHQVVRSGSLLIGPKE